MKGKNVFVLPCKKYSCQGIISLINSHAEPTQQAFAVEYGKIFPVFPVGVNKVPIVDYSLGFKNGFWDATSDLKLIARTWHKYPNARIGFALPEDLQVFDCDVKKDANKKPILNEGKPDIIGLKSFRKLIAELNLSEAELNTLTVKTQSEGRHFYYLMPEGIPSFNHNGALKGLDLKGYGGYVILPNSQGQYGRYEFLNLTEIRPIPEPLLNWVLKFKGKTSGKFEKLPTGSAKIDRQEIVRILTPYWAKADGKRNDLMLSIAGFIARSGGTEQDAVFVISELCRLAGKGYDHIPGAIYAFHREENIFGLTKLRQLMEEIEND